MALYGTLYRSKSDWALVTDGVTGHRNARVNRIPSIVYANDRVVCEKRCAAAGFGLIGVIIRSKRRLAECQQKDAEEPRAYLVNGMVPIPRAIKRRRELVT